MKKAYSKYIAALLLFGSNGVVASRIGLASYHIVLLRTLIGSLFLAGLFLLNKRKASFWNHKKELLFLVISGAAMGASWMLLYEAYAQIGVGIASLLYYCGPVIVMALTPVLFRERLDGVKIAALFVVLAGIFLLNGNALGAGGNLFGVVCGLLSAVLYAVMVIANKKAEHIDRMENALIQLMVSFLTAAVFVGIKDGYALQIADSDWVWILVLGLVNTGIGCYFYFSSIGALPVQSIALLGYLEPLSAVLFSAAFLHETMLPVQAAGAALILGGAFFGEYGAKRRGA